MSVCSYDVSSNSRYEEVRLHIWKTHTVDDIPLDTHGNDKKPRLGTPANELSSIGSDCFPELQLEYRVDRDGCAYHRPEFKAYYGEDLFRQRWTTSRVATEEEKHNALLCVLRLRTDQLRMQKVAKALKDRVDDAIIKKIANFFCP